MEGGCVSAKGRKRSSAASTSRRSSSKNGGSFIGAGKRGAGDAGRSSRFALAFRIEWLGSKFAVGFFQKNFHAAFRLFELLLAFAGQRHAFFEELHGVIKRKLRAFEAADNFLETREGALKVRLFRRLGFFCER